MYERLTPVDNQSHLNLGSIASPDYYFHLVVPAAKQSAKRIEMLELPVIHFCNMRFVDPHDCVAYVAGK